MNDELQRYIRMHPKWYIYLNRNPELFQEVMNEYKEATNQTFSSKLDRVAMVLKLIEMMV